MLGVVTSKSQVYIASTHLSLAAQNIAIVARFVTPQIEVRTRNLHPSSDAEVELLSSS